MEYSGGAFANGSQYLGESENGAVLELCITQSAKQDVLSTLCVLSAGLVTGILGGQAAANKPSIHAELISR